MPASEVMNLYRQHKLHSGPGGPVVKKKKQAVAIQISMARKEGHHIPEVKGSFQQGGLVPETGNYKVHQGEHVTLDDSGMERQRPLLSRRIVPPGYGTSGDVEDRRHEERTGIADIAPMPEQAQRSAQAADIAARTNQAQHDAWNRAMHQKEDWGGAMGRGRPSDMLGQPPQPRDIPPAGNDPHYAVEGLKGNVAQRMREQGERAAGIRGSFDQGGTVEQTGDYKAHQGEEIVPPAKTGGQSDLPVGRELIGSQADMVPPIRAIAPGPSTSIQNVPKKGAAPPVGGNPALEQMQAAVAAPLQRASSNFDAPPASYKTGGTIPRTGVYRLHAGEHVIPASLAKRYREMKK